MDISRQYEELVISGYVCVVIVDEQRVKTLVRVAKDSAELATTHIASLKSKDNYFPILVQVNGVLQDYARALLYSIGVEVDDSHLYLALCVRFPGLELDYTLLESIRGKCEMGDGVFLKQLDWKKVELYVRMFLGVMSEYCDERGWK